MRKILLFFSVNILTVATIAQIGPGGVGNASNNEIWLPVEGNVYIDAGSTLGGNNSSIQQWNDISGNINHATQTNAGFKPTLRTNQLNGLSTLRFDGSSDRILTTGIDTGNTATIIVVVKFNNLTNNNDGIIQAGPAGTAFSTSSSDKSIGMWINTSSGKIWGRGVQANNSMRNLPADTILSTGQFYIITQQYDGTNITQYVDGIPSGIISYNGTLKDWSDFGIGRQASESLDGDIAEILVYNRSLNTAQLIITNNYLSAKYGLTLNAYDVYTQDNVGNGNYDYEVAGIGRMNASSIHNDAQGTGMVRILNPTNLGNNEFLIWGHDNGVAQAINTTDIPAPVLARFDRVWRVSEVNTSGSGVNVGNIDMRWDLTGLGAVTASDLRLLIDTDNDGVFADETPISGATSLGGNIYQFAGVSAISNNRRFTLATINRVETPLPIELLSFEATINEGKVDLRWITATEINNDYFTIERSDNLKDWNEVIHVKGAENSNQELSYYDVDYFPIQGLSYYRLKQTDFDGKFTYSNIVPVNFISSNIGGKISLFPNPTEAGKTINLEFKNIIESEILVVLRDIQGKEYYSKMVVNIEDGKLIGVPIETSIPAGIYLVTATSESQMYSQKLIVR